MKIVERYKIELTRILATIFLVFTTGVFVSGQTPTHVPRSQPEPVGFFDSWENVVFYVIIPILIIVFYFLWKRDVAKRKKNDQDNLQ